MSFAEETDELKPERVKPGIPSKRNRRKHSQSMSEYLGVRKRSWGRYVSEIRLPGKKTRIWLGSYVEPEMAARAFDSAAFFLRGNSAALNFPESAGLLPRPESCSRTDIQAAAAKAAVGLGFSQDGMVDQGRFDMGFEWESWGGLTSFEDVKEAPILGPMGMEFATWDEMSGDSQDILLPTFCNF